jgi:ABC-type Mn2+/Zn2+ transport system permease subunit
MASASGLLVSFRYDLPTGPVVVCMFGLVLILAGIVRRLTGVTVPAVDDQPVHEVAA